MDDQIAFGDNPSGHF